MKYPAASRASNVTSSSHMWLSGVLLCWKGKIIIAQQRATQEQNAIPNGLIGEQMYGFL